MKFKRFTTFFALGLTVCVGGSLLDSAFAQKTKGKTRAASTKQLMKGLVQPNCAAVGAALKAESPDWDAIAQHAAILNEAGYLLMDDGRCPDGEWAMAAKRIQSASQELLAKAEAKDKAGAESAFKAVTGEGCAVCHKAHKGK